MMLGGSLFSNLIAYKSDGTIKCSLGKKNLKTQKRGKAKEKSVGINEVVTHWTQSVSK